MSVSQELYTHAKQRIPGGVQPLSKRPEMYAPDQWPNYAVKAKGCEVWDLEGNRYYDMTTNGIGACLLGYADPDVNKAVISRVENGCMSTLNPPEEVYLADKLVEIHPCAPGFLEHVRDEIHRVGGLLIYDEISIGWRHTFGGSHKVLGVTPDMATFAKAMGNGHPTYSVDIVCSDKWV